LPPQKSAATASSSAGIDEATLVEVMEEIDDETDAALAAFAEKSSAMFGEVVRQRARPEQMALQSLAAWQSEMVRITSKACSRTDAKPSDFTSALQYWSPRSERVAELEAAIAATRPKTSFKRDEVERISAAAEEDLVDRLRSRVEALERRGMAPGSPELSSRVGLELSKLREQSVESALDEEGPGTAAAAAVFHLYSGVYGMASWPKERKFQLRMVSVFRELGLGPAADAVVRQVAAKDGQQRMNQAQAAMRGGGGGRGMIGGM